MNVAMVAADETKWVAYGPCRILAAFGTNAQATDRYIQFHANPTVAASDVPAVKSLYAPASTGFSYGADHFGNGIDLAELTIAISSDAPSYTALTNTGLDLTVIVDTEYPVVSGTTTLVGDLTTGVDATQIWATANGHKRLLRLDFKNSTGEACYPVILARDTALETALGRILPKVADGETRKFFFGRTGGQIVERTELGIQQKGCLISSVAASAAGFPFTFPVSASTYIRAVYE